jgi:clathrin heavy chain
LLGVQPQNIGFTTVTIESDHYICIREKGSSEQQGQAVVIVDLHSQDPQNSVVRRPITADAALMHPTRNILALKAGRQLQLFSVEAKSKIKSFLLGEEVSFWCWASSTTLALVTESAVFHWSIAEGEPANAPPVRLFERHSSLAGAQIISYRAASNWMCLVGIRAQQKRIAGTIQLHSMERNLSQIIEGHVGAFAEADSSKKKLFCFAGRSTTTGQGSFHVVEVGNTAGTGQPASRPIKAELTFPPEFPSDFPVSLQVNSTLGLAYIITKYGFMHVFEVETGELLCMQRISPDPLFLSVPHEASGGILVASRKGQILSLAPAPSQLIPYLLAQEKPALALLLAARGNFPGAETLFSSRFSEAVAREAWEEAARIAALAPNSQLRTAETIETLKQAIVPAGTVPPLLLYFSTLLQRKDSKLNKQETLELVKPVLQQSKLHLLHDWLRDNRLECSEELGDAVKVHDSTLALSVYLRASIPAKAALCFADLGQWGPLILYARKTASQWQPDWLAMLKTELGRVAETGTEFARVLLSEHCLTQTQVLQAFSSLGLVQQATAFFLEPLKADDSVEIGELQTKLLELQLVNGRPNVADAILEAGFFTRFDREAIARLAEEAGLEKRALENYTETADIKRVLLNCRAGQLEADWLVKFFGKLSPSAALECMRELLRNNNNNGGTNSQGTTAAVSNKSNAEICVAVAAAYCSTLGADNCIELFEGVKAYDLLYAFLSKAISTSTDPQVHYKYIQAAYRTAQYKEMERVIRESDYYPPEQVINFLKEAKSLPDQLPLIIVCDRWNRVADLVSFLHHNNLSKYLQVYLKDVNPSKLPDVIASLIDEVAADDESILGLLSSVSISNFDVSQLTDVLEQRGRLAILRPWLEYQCGLIKSDSGESCPSRIQSTSLFNALAKIYIDCANSPAPPVQIDTWLAQSHTLYDSLAIGKYCSKINPNLAFICFEQGGHDQELIDLTNENLMFKAQARYLVRKRDPALWQSALAPSNLNRTHLIDQIIAVALPETQDPEEVSVAVKSFMEADMPNQLIDLLEKIVLQNSTMFSDNRNLQNLLILTAIKAEKDRVADYATRLTNYDAPEIAQVAITNGLFEEAYAIYHKHDAPLKALEVLIDQLHDLDRASSYAEQIDTPAVWSALGKGLLEAGKLSDSIQAFTHAEDYTQARDIVATAHANEQFSTLLPFLQAAKRKLKNDPWLEGEFLFCLARLNKLSLLEEAISTPTPSPAPLAQIAERCYEAGLWDAAKVLYSSVAACPSTPATTLPKLASTLVRLREWQSAVEIARKANSTKVWREVGEACLKEREFRLGQICCLNLILAADELEQVCASYERLGLFDQLISLLESGLSLERVHMGIFTELASVYARHREEKLEEHLKKHASKINLPKLLRVLEAGALWRELALAHFLNEEYDLSIQVQMKHSVEAWDPSQFKETLVRVTNLEIYYKALRFYLEEHPLLLPDLLTAMIGARGTGLDLGRIVSMFQKSGHLPLIRTTLFSFASGTAGASGNNHLQVNNALIDLMLEEEALEDLRLFISTTDSFDQQGLASRLEKHDLAPMRLLGMQLWRRNKKFKQALQIARQEREWSCALSIAAESQHGATCEGLLREFAAQGLEEWFVAGACVLYEWTRPDVALEIAWRKGHGWMGLVVPFVCQVMRDVTCGGGSGGCGGGGGDGSGGMMSE